MSRKWDKEQRIEIATSWMVVKLVRSLAASLRSDVTEGFCLEALLTA